MSITLKKSVDTITPKLKAMLSRGSAIQGYLNRVVYPQYQNIQRRRWMTENVSEGSKWKALNPVYAAYKLKRYGGGPKHKFIGGRGIGNTGFDSTGRPRPWEEVGTWPNYPGSGRKMMIATNTLIDSVVGNKTKFHRKYVSNTQIRIATTVEYAEKADAMRPFTTYSRRTMKAIMKDLATFLDKGVRPQVPR